MKMKICLFLLYSGLVIGNAKLDLVRAMTARSTGATTWLSRLAT
jgi:hypothetical protein